MLTAKNTILTLVLLLVFAAGSDASWLMKSISTGDVRGISCVADANDVVHVAYKEGFDIRYASSSAGSWYICTIDTCGWKMQNVPVALDSAGHPHIAYVDINNYLLKHAYWTGTQWTVQPVDTVSGTPTTGYIGMEIDSLDNIHIAYGKPESSSLTLKLATWDGVRWSTQTIDSGTGYGYVALALDSNRKPHIAYSKGTQLYHSHGDGATWNTSLIDPAIGAFEYHSITIDSQNRPHIAYTYDYRLRYAKWTGAVWDVRIIYDSWHVNNYASIKLDAQDYPHITFTSQLHCNYMKWTGTAWELFQFDSASTTGGYESFITFDAHGNPLIVYSDQTEQFKLTRWTNNPVLAPVDGEGDVPKVGHPFENIVFRVKYSDSEGDAPKEHYPKVHFKIDGKVVRTLSMQYESGEPVNGVVYTTSTFFTSVRSNLEYGFEAFDMWGSSAPGISGKRLLILDTDPVLNWVHEGINTRNGTSPTVFVFRVSYTDNGNDMPKQGYPALHIMKDGSDIAGSPFLMQEENQDDTRCADGKMYRASLRLPPGIGYAHYVEAYDSYGFKASGEPCDSRPGPEVSDIVLAQESDAVVIGPSESRGIVNPDKNNKAQIYFQGNQLGRYTCGVYNSEGEIIFSDERNNVNTGTFEWIPQDIASGIYTVRIEGPDMSKTRRLAIVR